MMKLPEVVGLTLCERVEIDPLSGQLSLVGVFHFLPFSVFPSPAREFTLYGALFDGFGEGTMELVVTRAKTNEDIYIYQRWLSFPQRLGLVNLEIKVRRCLFPAPGRYGVSLRFDQKEAAVRSLNIFAN